MHPLKQCQIPVRVAADARQCLTAQVVRIARQVLALPLVNIGGIDIVNGQHKLLLAILWQLMRYNIRGLLQARLLSLLLHCLS